MDNNELKNGTLSLSIRAEVIFCACFVSSKDLKVIFKFVFSEFRLTNLVKYYLAGNAVLALIMQKSSSGDASLVSAVEVDLVFLALSPTSLTLSHFSVYLIFL